jgi:hypothetical protein
MPIVYRVFEDTDSSGRVYPAIYKMEYLGRRGSWRRFRNTDGQEWSERGMRWFESRELALRHYIQSKYPSEEQSVIWALFGNGRTQAEFLEENFRLMVKACGLLLSVWRFQEEAADKDAARE